MEFKLVHLVFLIAVFLPALHVLVSPRNRGPDRWIWLLAVLAFSWMAYTVWLAWHNEPATDLSDTEPQGGGESN